MKISVLVPNLATNCIVRSWPIIKVLERQHEVEIIGTLFGDTEIFAPYAAEYPYKIIRWKKPWQILSGLRHIQQEITGDLIYAFKPLPASFGAALLERKRREVPVILDIEDWETWKLYQGANGIGQKIALAKYLLGPGWREPHSWKYKYIVEKLISRADGVTVVSRFLQNRYGGVRVYHGPDTGFFDPARFSRTSLRKKWEIDPEIKIILFAGNPSPYKGLEDLLHALKRIKKQDGIRLLLVGRDEHHPFTRQLKDTWKEQIMLLGYQPHARMPEFLAMADMVVLPQRQTPITMAQVPAKVFEAMAMAKPIIASALSDLPEILEGAGLVVEPEKVDQIAAGIDYILEDEQRAASMGQKARERCINHYGWDAMEKVLQRVLESVISKQKGGELNRRGGFIFSWRKTCI